MIEQLIFIGFTKLLKKRSEYTCTFVSCYRGLCRFSSHNF